MANEKEKIKIQDNEHDDDLDFNFDDLNFDDIDDIGKSDSRKPVDNLKLGLKKSIKDRFSDKGFIKTLIQHSLPDSYQTTFEAVDKVKEETHQLYNEAVRDLRPTIPVLQKAAEFVAPKLKNKGLKSLSERLEDFSKHKSSDHRQSAESDEDDSKITDTLTTIFNIQDKNRIDDQAKQEIKDLIGRKTALKQNSFLSSIDSGIGRLTNYQDQVLVKYHQKSVELGFRQFFLLRDILKHQKESSQRDIKFQEAVVKNTALPEITKIKLSESIESGWRQLLVGEGQKAAISFLGKFKNNIKNSVKDIIGGVASATDLVGSGLDAVELSKDLGLNAHEQLGGFAGSAAIGALGKAASNKIKDHLNKNENVNSLGYKLKYYLENISGESQKFARSSKLEDGILGGLISVLKDQIPIESNSTMVGNNGIFHSENPVNFTARTRLTINDIIPGFLSRIHQELRILRTGNDKLGRLEYSLTKNMFVSGREASLDLKKQIFNPNKLSYAKNSLNNFIGFLDKDKKLSPETKAALMKQIASDIVAGKSFDPNKYVNPNDNTGHLSDNHISEIKEKLGSRFKGPNGLNYKDMSEAHDFYKFIGNQLPIHQDIIKAHLQTGQIDRLKKMGLVVQKGNEFHVNYNEIGSRIVESDSDDEYLKNELKPNASKLFGQKLGKNLEKSVANAKSTIKDLYLNGENFPRIRANFLQAGQYFSAKTGSVIKEFNDIKDGVVDRYGNLILTKKEALVGIDAINKNNSSTMSDEKINPSMKNPFKLHNFQPINQPMPEPQQQNTVEMPTNNESWQNDVVSVLTNILNALSKRDFTNPKPDLSFVENVFVNSYRRAKKVGSGFLSFAKNYTKVAYKLQFGLAKKAVKLPIDFINKSRDYFQDIFIVGESKPVLYGKNLKNGDYIDKATGKVIKSLKDIKGDVIDKNGNTVLTAEDIKKGLMDNRGKKISSKIFKLISSSSKMLGNYYSWAFKGQISLISAGINGLKSLKNWVEGPADVYVKGRTKPSLFASIMKNGGYFSKKTGKVISRPLDIDGEVVDAQNNIVLTAEEIKEGLTNVFGNPFKTVGGNIAGLIGASIRTATKVAKGVFNYTIGAWKMMGKAGIDFVKGLFGGVEVNIGGKKHFKKTNDILFDIYELLKTRIPNNKNFRKGSWQELREKESQETKEKNKDDVQPKNKSSFLSKIFGSKKDQSKSEETTNIDLGSGKEEKSKKPKGRLGRLGDKISEKLGKSRFGRGLLKTGNVLGRVGSGAGKVLGRGGRLLLGGLGLEGLLGGLGAGSLLGGSLGLIEGAAGVAGALGSGALAVGGSLLAGAGAILSSPVILTGLAIGATAYGGYKLYQHFSKKSVGPLTKIRLTQYGLDFNNNDHISKILELESMLNKRVVIDGTQGTIKTEGLDISKIFEDFNLSGELTAAADKGERRLLFLRWFDKRFKPIFISHYVNLNQISKTCQLKDIDSGLKKSEKLKFIEQIQKIDSNYYSVKDSPFHDYKLITDARIINNLIETIKSDLQKQSDSKDGKSTTEQIKMAGSNKPPTSMLSGSLSFDNKNNMSMGVMMDDDKSSKATALVVDKIKGGSEISLSQFTDNKGKLKSTVISAMTAIRLKAFGLKSFLTERVKALFTLETEVLDDVQYDTNGKASFTGDPQIYFNKYCSMFGTTADNSERRDLWINWFSNRFIPVLLKYASSVKAIKKSIDPRDAERYLSPDQLVDVAQAVIGTKTTIMLTDVPIWSLGSSPWGDEVLNNNSDSTNENLESLKSLVKKKIYDQEMMKKKENGQEVDPNWKPYDGVDADALNGTKPKSFIDKILPNKSGFIRKTYDSIFGSKSDTSNSGTTSSSGNSINMGSMGESIEQPGHGTGGDINAIPSPKSNRSKEALRPTIEAAARAAGISPSLAMTVANIESSYDYLNKASTSSAKGLFQFLDSTWKSMIVKYGDKYGMSPMTSPLDPRANSLMGAEFLKENAQYLGKALGRQPTDTEVYLAHFLGPDGAVKLLKAGSSAIAAQVNPPAAQSNKTIFYKKDGSPRTVSEVVALMDEKVRKNSDQPGSSKTDSNKTNIPSSMMAKSSASTNMATSFNNVNSKPPAPASKQEMMDRGGITTTTANGPTGGIGPSVVAFNPSDLPAGNGRSMLLDKNNNVNIDSPILASSAQKINVVPSIDKSDGLKTLNQQVNGNNAAVMSTQERKTAMMVAGDMTSKKYNDSLMQEINNIETILNNQLNVLKQILESHQEAVKMMGEMSTGNQVSDSQSTTQNSNNVNSANRNPSNIRGNETLGVSPVNVKRTI